MDSFKGSHRYRRLRGSDIRVVRFKPCPFDQDNEILIEGCISHVPLEKSNVFALSYVWGDASNTRTINLDGQEFPVTINLWTAITRLRNRYDPDRKPYDSVVPQVWTRQIHEDDSSWTENAVCWWIDAICINQTATKERSQQVPRMKNLFGTATRVVVWFGDVRQKDTWEITRAFRAGEKLNDILKTSTNPGQLPSSPGERIKLLLEIESRPEDIALAMLFIHRTGHVWATRVWTLQEAVLPREEPAAVIGSEVTGLWTLANFQECFTSIAVQLRLQNQVTSDERDILALSDLYGVYILATEFVQRPERHPKSFQHHRRKILARIYTHITPMIQKASWSRTDSSTPSLSDSLTEFGNELLKLLRRSSGRESTVLSDRIYGVLGLTVLPNLPMELRPDYRTSFGGVCFAYTKFLIKASRNLQVLALGVAHFEGYPTWVPDFSQNGFSSNGVTTLSPIFSEDDRCLTVAGVKLGKILAIEAVEEANFGTPPKGDPSSVLNKFCDFARNILVPASTIRACGVAEIFQDLAEKSALSAFGASEKDIVALAACLEISGSSTWTAQASSCVPALETYLTIVTHALLDSGMICWWSNNTVLATRQGKATVATGDVIFSLNGTDFPTVLRSCNQSNGFEVLGTCYAMTSESMDFSPEYVEGKQVEITYLY